MHHAYVQYGSLSLLPTLEESARDFFGFKKHGDPDVQVLKYEKFGIEEARDLRISAGVRSVSGKGLYIVGVSSITTEAQQALLKLFEEPQEGLIFVLLAPHGAIIPTLRSRLLDYSIGGASGRLSASTGSATKSARGLTNLPKVFLSASVKTRSAEITKLLKDDEGVRERVRDFLNGIEVSLHGTLLKTKGKKEIREALEDIAKVRNYMGDRSPSLKMLLEHLALSLPVLK